MKLIFAQGNPEPEYTGLRHNLGFLILNNLADKFDIKWVNKSKFSAHIAELNLDKEKIILVKPTSFYNETGPILKKLVDFYKLNPQTDLLIIHDDLSLDFGVIRVREKGSNAGNNGIKSINNFIYESYKRIRIGIKNDLAEKMDDSDFVLSKFSKKEQEQLEDKIVPDVIDLVKQFCNDNLKITSYKS